MYDTSKVPLLPVVVYYVGWKIGWGIYWTSGPKKCGGPVAPVLAPAGNGSLPRTMVDTNAGPQDINRRPIKRHWATKNLRKKLSNWRLCPKMVDKGIKLSIRCKVHNATRLAYNCTHLRLNNKKNKNKLSQNGARDWTMILDKKWFDQFSRHFRSFPEEFFWGGEMCLSPS